ncbi:ABC transporter substrate-binding protein [Salmonella enterica]|nr:ABC transporter substrate-binding protein [Salmonella enterica]
MKNMIRVQWSCLVDGEGNTAILEDREGMMYISHSVDLIRYARAFMQTGAPCMVFHQPAGSRLWRRVVIQRRDDVPDGPSVSVQVTLISPPYNLSVRELDVLTLIAASDTSARISSRLSLSLRTVEKHTENLLRKTGAVSRTALAVCATDRGIVRLPTPGGVHPGGMLTVHIVERMSSGMMPPAADSPVIHQTRPLTIGIPVIDSGKGSEDSTEMLRGAELAVREINGRGGVNGRALKIITESFHYDDAFGKRRAFGNLIECESDVIISGYACYSSGVHELIGESGIPCLHATTLSQAVDSSRQACSNLFQSCATDIHYSSGIRRFIHYVEQHFPAVFTGKTMVILRAAGSAVEPFSARLRTFLTDSGWRVEYIDVSSDSFCNWNAAVDKIVSLSASLIVLASFFVEDAIRFQEIFIRHSLPAFVYVIYSPSVPLYIRSLGNLSEDVVWATTSGVCPDVLGRKFSHAFKNYYAVSPGLSQCGLAYDRVNVLAEAWFRSRYPRIYTNVISILQEQVITGVNGTWYFGRERECRTWPDNGEMRLAHPHLMYQIRNGKHLCLLPSQFAEAELRLPWWFGREGERTRC